MKGLIFTYLLTSGGAVLSLANPFLGLLIYVCFSIIKPDLLWDYSVPEGNYSRIVAVALLVGWLINGFGSWQFGRATGGVWALLAFFAWTALSSAQANSPDVSWAYAEQLAKVVLPFLVGITTINSIAKVRALVWVIVASHGFLAYEFNLSYYQGFNRVQIMGFGMDNNCVAIAMNSCIGLAFFLGLYSQRWWEKALAFGAALLMAHVVLFSFSRGGMIGLIITGLTCFIVIPKKTVYYLYLLAVVLLVFRLAGPEVQARFFTSFAGQSDRDYSAQSRLDMWRDCVDVAMKNPVFGVGPRNWPLIAHNYGWAPGKEAHSLWLQIAAEWGWFGLGLLLWFYGGCIAKLTQFLRSSTALADSWPRHIACMVIASLVGFAVSAQFVSLVGLETPYYVTLVGLGVIKLTSLPTEASVWDLPPSKTSAAAPGWAASLQ